MTKKIQMKPFKPLEEDIVYQDGEYQIYKKDAGALGTIPPALDIIDIGINGIKEIPLNFLDPKDIADIALRLSNKFEREMVLLGEASRSYQSNKN